MVVYICCFGGVTSCFFCRHIQKINDKEVYVDHIDAIATNYDEITKRYKYVIAYGPVAYLCEEQIKEKNLHHFLKHVFICPQARYLIASLKEFLEKYDLSISCLDMKLFGCTKASEIVKAVKSEMDTL